MISKRWHALALLALPLLAACGEQDDGASEDSRRATPRDTVVIDGTAPTCAQCALEVMQPIRLGTPDDEHVPQRVPEIVRDSRGTHYLVFNGWSNKQVLRYDSAGRYLGRLGQYGQGPGEYRMTLRLLIGPGDSVFLFDWSSRAQVFTPDGVYVRGIRTPGQLSVFAVARDGSGSFFGVSNAYGIDSTPPLVIRLDSTWSRLDSFPAFAPVIGRSFVRSGSREWLSARRPEFRVALAPDGSVWASGRSNYRLERHGRDGTTQQVIGVRIPGEWLLMTAAEADSIVARQPPPKPVPRRPVRPPPSRIRSSNLTNSLTVDSAGLLWVVRVIPVPGNDTITLSAQYLSPNEAPDEATIPREVQDRLYHTVVDVIDPRGPELIARAELPFFGHAAGPGYVGRVTQDDNGHYVSMVYRLALRRGPP